jgi:hypothetical protein
MSPNMIKTLLAYIGWLAIAVWILGALDVIDVRVIVGPHVHNTPKGASHE